MSDDIKHKKQALQHIAIPRKRKTAEEIEEEEWDALVQSSHGQRALRHLLKEARREIAAGKTEEGG